MTALLVALGFVVGCGAQDDESGALGSEERGASIGGKGDRLGQRAGVLTLEAEPVVSRGWDGDDQALVVKIRSSRMLNEARSVALGSPEQAPSFGQAHIVDETSVAVVLTGPDATRALAGEPIGLVLATTWGTPDDYMASVTIGARFAHFSGDQAIWVHDEIEPVYVAGAEGPVFRARAFLDQDYDLVAYTDDDSDPALSRAGAPEYGRQRWFLDFPAHSFAYTFDYDGDRIYVDAYSAQGEPPSVPEADTDAGPDYQKELGIEAHVTDLALGVLRYEGRGATRRLVEAPFEAPVCSDAVGACVGDALASGGALSECGGYFEVSLCAGARSSCDDPTPFRLTSIGDVDLNDPAFTPILDACEGDRFQGCEIRDFASYTAPLCTGLAPLDALDAAADHFVTRMDYYWYEDGDIAMDVRYRGTLAAADDRSVDAAMRDGVETALGGAASEALFWYGTREIPCPNCTTYAEFSVGYAPATGLVVGLHAHYGYDS